MEDDIPQNIESAGEAQYFFLLYKYIFYCLQSNF